VLSPAVPIVCSLRLDGKPPALLLVEPDCPEIVVPQPRNSSSSSSTHDCCDLVPIVGNKTLIQRGCNSVAVSISEVKWSSAERIWVVGCEKWRRIAKMKLKNGKSGKVRRWGMVVTGEGKSRSDWGGGERGLFCLLSARNTNAVFLNSTIPTPWYLYARFKVYPTV